MFTVNTHGNRHRLTIVATDDRKGNTYRLDTGTADKHGPAFTDLMLHDDGMSIQLDWQLIAAMIAKAYKQGQLQPKHVYRVPAWGLMPQQYQQALFNLFMEAAA